MMKRTPWLSTVWIVFLSTIFIQLIGTVFYFVILKNPAAIQPVYVITKGVMLLSPVVLVFLFGFLLAPLCRKRTIGASVGWGVLSGLAISGLTILVYVAFQDALLPFAGNVREKIADVGIAEHYLLAALGISLAHSLLEEYFWRWYVVRGLEARLSANASLWIGGWLFALHHYILLSQFFGLGMTIVFGTFVGIGGVMWSLIYRRTGSLLAPWLSHALVDGTLFYIGFLLIRDL